MSDQDLAQSINRRFTRNLRNALLWGFFFGRLRHYERKNRLACQGVAGQVEWFSGRNVCQVDDVSRIDEVWQRESGGYVTMVAKLDNGRDIFITPDSLNRWRSEYEVKKSCADNMCQFTRI